MDIREYKSLSADGRDWTAAFQAAVNCLRENGGGTIFVPAGTYPTGSIRLESNMNLHVESGATLLFHQDEDAFPVIPMQDKGRITQVHQACVYAKGAENVSISGKGKLDGQGSFWWQGFKEKKLRYPRPRLICFDHCENVSVEDVTLVNSPSWTVNPWCCRYVTVRGITIHNPWDSPNTDGINPDSCQDVKITGCTVDVGDDCITLKAGTESTVEKLPCERIVISDCHLLHGHGGIVLGSEMSGGVRNVIVSNCVFYETDRGIRLKTRRGRGGAVEGLQAQNLLMDRVMCPFVFNMYYFCGPDGKTDFVRSKEPLPLTPQTPVLRNVSISNVSVRGCGACAGYFYGLPESKVEGIILRDVRIEMDPDSPGGVPAMMDDCPPRKGAGFYLRNATQVTLNNVQVSGHQGDIFDMDESVQLLYS